MTCSGCDFSESGHIGPDYFMRRSGVNPSFSAGCNLFQVSGMQNATLKLPVEPAIPGPMTTPVKAVDRGEDGQARAVSVDSRVLITITLTGKIRGGKNNMVITRNGLHFPKPEWKRWRDEAMRQVLPQKIIDTITHPCRATVNYWAGDRKRRDIPAIIDAIWHVLERSGIVEDDSLIKSVVFNGGYDKENPRAIVSLSRENVQ